MNIWVLVIEALIFAALFTSIVFVNYRGNKKYSAAAIHNYPPDIQEEYFKTHQRVDVSYIAEEFARTDLFVKKMYVPKGFFTPPFETKESLESRLKGLYREAEVHAVRAEGIFRCVK